MKNKIFFVLPFFLCLSIFPAAGTAAKIEVSVAIPPLAFAVKRIGGLRIANVNILLPPGKSPANYRPSPKQLIGLARSRVFFQTGLPFENHLLARMKGTMSALVVDTRKGITMVSMSEHRHHHDDIKGGERGERRVSEHGKDCAGLPDPHIWLDPALFTIQAATIRDALIGVDPDGRAEYEKGFRLLESDLTRLNQQVKEALHPLLGQTIYVFHPAYGYFCRAYGLVQKAVETGGKQPGARYLAGLIKAARKDKVKVIFVQPQFARRSAESIALAIGGVVIPLDPMDEDYLTNIKQMADKITAAFSTGISSIH